MAQNTKAVLRRVGIEAVKKSHSSPLGVLGVFQQFEHLAVNTFI